MNYYKYTKAFFEDDISRICEKSPAQYVQNTPPGFSPIVFPGYRRGADPMNPKHYKIVQNLKERGFSYLCAIDLEFSKFGAGKNHPKIRDILDQNKTYDNLTFCPGGCFAVNSSLIETAIARRGDSFRYLARFLGAENAHLQGTPSKLRMIISCTELTEL